MDVTGFINGGLIETYNAFLSSLPKWAQNFLTLFVLVILVSVYAIFIWKLHKFIATKNIIKLNLSKYNTTKHPFLTKVLAVTFYFLEYIIILPFLICFWFIIFTLFLIFLTEGIELPNLLIISATIIAVIRITAYYREDLSKELAKLLPLTLLAVSITIADFFNIERIMGNLNEIPSFFSQILIYLSFIVVLEIVLRFFEFIFSLFDLEENSKIKDED